MILLYANREVREYGKRPGDTGGATYGTTWGEQLLIGNLCIVGVSLGQVR